MPRPDFRTKSSAKCARRGTSSPAAASRCRAGASSSGAPPGRTVRPSSYRGSFSATIAFPKGGAMKHEIVLLLWAVALTVVQMLIAVSGATLEVGLPVRASNLDTMPPLTGWVCPAQRAHFNMLESLVLFAALVLVAVVSSKTNQTTLPGAQFFFWGGVAYAAIYLAGIPWLRTGAWFVSLIGFVRTSRQFLT